MQKTNSLNKSGFIFIEVFDICVTVFSYNNSKNEYFLCTGKKIYFTSVWSDTDSNSCILDESISSNKWTFDIR